ncbi:low molecular weight protein-tyrosine-phosphatase [Alcanivorax sp.]|uniref:low molecular weight protein-tyrosine-phosphatase n=1 Tax=Alcanivorax sp. TaxID=1872427 RepID=UPI000C581B80|nr:low molecular weight protein-tyrosine-phosphatase [Alcanivorax sp.]MBQ23767.1 protein tyrosine phosphatase [Alcanivorax sp.]|tara:strand:+ start:621 stop:1049 length:429 start_codon:yes stop_codon:yes gene_type:complete
MFNRILVVCDGNICRSPTVAAMLRELKPEKAVSSAGLVGLVGQDMEATARVVAEENGLDCGTHVARKLDSELCRDSDLILVMESRQKERLGRAFPEASGKTFLLSHWNGGHDIPDPYKRGRDAFERIYPPMREATKAWAEKL